MARRWNGGVTKYEIEPICSSGLCESPGSHHVPQGTLFGSCVHFAISLTSSTNGSLVSFFSSREREREKERALSSRYHKSFEVLIRSHTQRLFRAWHPPDLAPTWRIIRRPLHGLCPRDIPSLFVLKRSLPEIHGLSAKRK